jgi:hypothetical protein
VENSRSEWNRTEYNRRLRANEAIRKQKRRQAKKTKGR